jgi:hypothetical protein
MPDLVAALAVLGLFATVLGGLAWVAVRARRRGSTGDGVAFIEEIWHPAAHRARLESRHQEERPAPSPLPGDRLFDL